MNHVDAKQLKMNSLRTKDYYVNFLSRHSDDSYLCDDIARWWINWHGYHLDNQNVSMYNDRILFCPKRETTLNKYIC